MKHDKTERMISDLLRQEAIRDFKELGRLLNDPMLVNSKKSAQDICTMLITMLIGEGIVKEGEYNTPARIAAS
jgi:hypothetical protein